MIYLYAVLASVMLLGGAYWAGKQSGAVKCDTASLEATIIQLRADAQTDRTAEAIGKAFDATSHARIEIVATARERTHEVITHAFVAEPVADCRMSRQLHDAAADHASAASDRVQSLADQLAAEAAAVRP